MDFSDLSYLTRAVFIVWTFFWILQHIWHIDRFEALRWQRVRRFELKSAITILLLVMCPLQIFYDIITVMIKYQEGFLVVPGTNVIIGKPYLAWSPAHQSLNAPVDYVLCANFSVQTSLLFLLQSFWKYLANSLAKSSFMGSFEFKSYILYSVFSLVIFPLLQFMFRNNEIYMETIPELAYAIFLLIIALLGIRSHWRFSELISKNRASARQSVLTKLEYFKDMNRCLTMALLIGSTSMIILCIDGLTDGRYLNSHKFTADLLITHVSFGLYLVFVFLVLIFYPARSVASDHVSVGKNSSCSKKSVSGGYPLSPPARNSIDQLKNSNNNNDSNNSPLSSQPSTCYIDMGEDSNFKSSKMTSRPIRPDSLDTNTTYVQMSPVSTLSPYSPPLSSTPSSTVSPKSSPSHSLTYPPPTTRNTHVKPVESEVIRPIPLHILQPSENTQQRFTPPSPPKQSPLGPEADSPLKRSRKSSVISLSSQTPPSTPRKSPNRPPSIVFAPAIKVTSTSSGELLNKDASSVSTKLEIEKPPIPKSAVTAINENNAYVGSGSGFPTQRLPSQHRKRSSSSSSLAKAAISRDATTGLQLAKSKTPEEREAQTRKRSSKSLFSGSSPSLRSTSSNNTITATSIIPKKRSSVDSLTSSSDSTTYRAAAGASNAGYAASTISSISRVTSTRNSPPLTATTSAAFTTAAIPLRSSSKRNIPPRSKSSQKTSSIISAVSRLASRQQSPPILPSRVTTDTISTTTTLQKRPLPPHKASSSSSLTTVTQRNHAVRETPVNLKNISSKQQIQRSEGQRHQSMRGEIACLSLGSTTSLASTSEVGVAC